MPIARPSSSLGIIRSRAYRPEAIARQAEMLANRVKKNYQNLAGRFEKRNIGAFRLYDWDIPEIRAIVDWYEGHLVIGEYVREQTEGTNWLEIMGEAVAGALQRTPSQVHLRRRTTRPKEGERYQRLAEDGTRFIVRENELRFWVDLDSYLDTGLFSDHRETRKLIQKEAQGKRFLNLFAYTGSFTAYAALGGASSTTSVDRSERYLDWAKENLAINQLTGTQHRLLPADVRGFLREAARRGERWDLIMLDPPSFSTKAQVIEFDVQRDHRALVLEALAVLAPGGTLYFSTNHQRFKADLNGLPVTEMQDITLATTPVDFQRRTPHQAFRLSRAALHS